MSTLTRMLEVAQEIADRHGDVNEFLASYNAHRTSMGIAVAIETALREQDLLDVFKSRM